MMECDIKNEKCGYQCTGYDGSAEWSKIHKIAD